MKNLFLSILKFNIEVHLGQESQISVVQNSILKQSEKFHCFTHFSHLVPIEVPRKIKFEPMEPIGYHLKSNWYYPTNWVLPKIN